MVLISNFAKLGPDSKKAIVEQLSSSLKSNRALLDQANKIQVDEVLRINEGLFQARDYDSLVKSLTLIPPPIAVLFNIELGKRDLVHLGQ